MISGLQIRAARAALRWTIEELAQKSGLGVRTIKRFEAVDGIPSSRTSTLVELKNALEAAGIEFIGTLDDNPGIRLRSRKMPETRGAASD
jgi:transcriptional regulator with XRE-family HTH domain